MQFEWDENKNNINLVKHKINFETAAEAFKDPRVLIKFDRKVGNEIRWHLIGQIEKVLVVLVVYTHRNGKYRIISARPASKREKRSYYEQAK